MAQKRNYSDIKNELEEILDWFDGDSVDIDEALKKHEKAEQLLSELEAYLETAKQQLGE